MESTIYENFTLPSKGLIYDTEINPRVTLRSMTTLEEMKRLSPSDTPYKVMSDIIEACLQEPLGMHVYDLSLGDYQYLLHKLRTVTYGPEYKMYAKCAQCGTSTEVIANLDTIKINEYDPDIVKDLSITLPKTGKLVRLRFQTPHDLDEVSYQAKELKKRTKQNIDYSLLFSIMSMIDTVDGQKLDAFTLENFVKQLPNKDSNFIIVKSAELNQKVGLDTIITAKCGQCGTDMEIPFRFTSEFFGPTI